MGGEREEENGERGRGEKGLLKAISALLGWFCKCWASRAPSVLPSKAKPRPPSNTVESAHLGRGPLTTGLLA